MPFLVPLIDLVAIPGTRELWPDEFRAAVAKLEAAPDDKTAWGVIADWLDEEDANEPKLADAFRWVHKRANVVVAKSKYNPYPWEISAGAPHSVEREMENLPPKGHDRSTIPGLMARLATALKLVREQVT